MMSPSPPHDASNGNSLLLFAPKWVTETTAFQDESRVFDKRLVLLSSELGAFALPPSDDDGAVTTVLLSNGRKEALADTFLHQARQAIAHIQEEMRSDRSVLIQMVLPTTGDGAFMLALRGLLRTVELEMPRLCGQIIVLDQEIEPAQLGALLHDASCRHGDDVLRYVENQPSTLQMVELPPAVAVPIWRERGVYLITGGAGGLGMIFAREIATRVHAPNLILVGRSACNQHHDESLAELRALGAQAQYQQVDVSDAEAVSKLAAWAKTEFGRVNGVLHGAGVLRDAYLMKKDLSDLAAVFAPKVCGAVALDDALRNEELDFFVCFSSLASVTGSVGQSDYAAANGFLDQFSLWRNRLVADGERHGKTVTINWPLWADGGMAMEHSSASELEQRAGIVAMPSQQGFEAFYRSLDSGEDQVLVGYGHAEMLRKHLTGERKPPVTKGPVQSTPGHFKRKLIDRLKHVLAEVTKQSIGYIDAQEPLQSYGVDSIIVTMLNERLARVFGNLSKTIFYEYQTLDALALHLAERHQEASLAWTGVAKIGVGEQPAQVEDKVRYPVAREGEPIAVIGMSARLPGAPDLDAFWDNLQAGKNCINEIPKDRWSLDGFYEPDRRRAVEGGMSYSKWGGFLEGFADFDPLFFGISPKEAMVLDPQERLFLENCWTTLEHAALTRDDLAEQYGGRVGVFAGVTKNGFELYGSALREAGHDLRPRTSFSAVANRVSYFLNVNGPSLPVDTMCSSSLTAVHLACEALRQGACEIAFAGGVNLYQHPSSYVDLCATGMLSHDGKCRSFGRGGTGFVPGEGVASVLLKPLSQAQADGDNVYGLIRASAVNHGGHTQGFTVPSPSAQRDLIQSVLDRAGVKARSISYVEAHGTGTELGDPIELEGLSQAFRSDGGETRWCALGSVKASIGHLEAAAGIAGLLKVIQQMRHGQLAPNLNADELNPNLNLSTSPFTLQRELSPWGAHAGEPHRALVSSFGAGGANASLLVEEYVRQPIDAVEATDQGPYAIVLSARTEKDLRATVERLQAWMKVQASSAYPDVSASLSEIEDAVLGALSDALGIVASALELDVRWDEYGLLPTDRLRLIARLEDIYALSGFSEVLAQCGTSGEVAAFIHAQTSPPLPQRHTASFEALAYTLQLGREAMEFRLGLTASGWDELNDGLQNFLAGKTDGSQTWFGQVTSSKESQSALCAVPSVSRVIDGWLAQKSYDRLLGLWVQGIKVDWKPIYEGRKIKAVELPAYPFAKRRLWVGDLLHSVEPSVVHRPKVVPDVSVPMDSTVNGEGLVRSSIVENLSQCLALSVDEISNSRPFADYGLDSILCVGLVDRLNDAFAIELQTAELFDHCSVDRLTKHIHLTHSPELSSLRTVANPVRTSRDEANNEPPAHQAKSAPIAIIGMSGRFPGAPDVATLWAKIRKGEDLLTTVSRWDLQQDRGACNRGGFLSDIDKFDALFFNISGAEASYMDPQQRLFLEESWSALEDGGYAGDSVAGEACGVYVGCCNGDYQDLFADAPSSQSLWGNMGSVIPARIAYLLDLKGPALAIDTSCSSSLVAVHTACQALRTGEVDMALAGGVFVQATPKLYVSANRAGMLSPTGRCYSFDHRADGFVPGEGAGALLLKRLDDALADGDHIHGVIQGSGVNHDGTTNGITAPSASSQESLIRKVHANFGIDPDSIGLLEAHGTGTPLGDPIEYRALSAAFGSARATPPCALGSIKTNIGHTQFAAGVAGIIKVLLAMKHSEIPASLNFERANPAIQMEAGPFAVNTDVRAWPKSEGHARLGAVSSFGASGTNAHVILADPPVAASMQGVDAPVLVALSARTPEALHAAADLLRRHCQETPDFDLASTAFTLLIGRAHFEHRLCVVVRDRNELMEKLNLWLVDGDVREAHTSTVVTGGAMPSALEDIPEYRGQDDADYAQALNTLGAAYVQGRTINADDIRTLFSYCTIRRVPLPTYAFADTRFWVAGIAQPEKIVKPLFDITSQGGDRFAINIRKDASFIIDHQVKGQCVLPGVVVAELLRAALADKQNYAKRVWRIKDLAWLQPVTENDLDSLQLNFQPASDGALAFELRGSHSKAVFSKGYVEDLKTARPQAMNVAQLIATKCEQNLSAEACYDAIHNMGVRHGRTLQAICSVHLGADIAIAELALPAGAADGFDDAVIPPSLLDSAIQSAVAFTLAQGNGVVSSDVTPVPFLVESVEFYEPCSARMWAIMPRPKMDKDGNLARLDVDLVNEVGDVCVRILGCVSRPLKSSANSPATLLTQNWVPVSKPCGEKSSHAGAALVVGASSSQIAQLQSVWPQLHSIEMNLDASQESLMAILQQAGEPESIIFVADPPVCDAPADERLITAQRHITLTALRLIKAMLALGWDQRTVRWTVITVQAQAIRAGEVCHPESAGLHGLFGAMAKEYEQWPVRILDMQEGLPWPVDNIAHLPWDLRGSTLGYRDGEWLQPELLAYKPSTAPIDQQTYRQGGTYVVIGGAGGVGRVWSEMMVRLYQAKIIWVGRRPLDESIDELLDRLAEVGPRPIYIQADAANATDLAACHEQVIDMFGRIDGVVHSAITLRDQTLARMDDDRFLEALTAKVDISVRLAQTFDLPAMDFVLFFSSIQSFARMPGQSNYAAGCTFEDAYAHFLGVTTGTNVRVVNWGYWGQVGVVATEEIRERMARKGLISLEPDEAAEALDVLLTGARSQLAVVKLAENGSVETMNIDAEVMELSSRCPSIISSVLEAVPPQDDKVRTITAQVGGQMSDLDSEMAHVLWVQMRVAGLFDGATVKAEEIEARIPPLYAKGWLEETLRVLTRHGYLAVADEGFRIVAQPEDNEGNLAWNRWKARSEALNTPDRASHIVLVQTMLEALPEILTGQKPATEAMFPRSSLKLVEGVYRDNKVADYFNEHLCDVLVAAIQERLKSEPNGKLRLLEVGAGTGGTAMRVFARLKEFGENISEYCYTDLSKAFLIHAERQYRDDAPYLNPKILNVDKSVAEQGIDEGSYDFVIATNVMHATGNIRRSLRNIKAAMKANGLFLINELNDNVLFSHLTFGLLEGWWSYDDVSLRIPGSPALSCDRWQSVLEGEGFQKVAFPASAAHGLGQQIVVAESDGVIRQQNVQNQSIALMPNVAPKTEVAAADSLPKQDVQTKFVREEGVQFLRTLVAETIQVPAAQIDASVPLERYGVDSLLVLQVVNQLRQFFPDVSSTLLFEVNTLHALVDHFSQASPEAFRNALTPSSVADDPQPPRSKLIPVNIPSQTKEDPAQKAAMSSEHDRKDIAIVGLSVRFPQADDAGAFWDNLLAGQDCITTVPEGRWAWEDFYDDRPGEKGAIASKWGGFLDGIDEFDPLFFHLSPAEAEQMDPQERLFLQEAYHSIEDAGYDPSTIGQAQKVGVFVGVMNAHYPTRAAFWSVANRVSFLLDLKGPSMAVDTACSSSLTAVHLAVESLRAGSSDMVIAGGVNLIVHPRHMATLSDLSLLSPQGRCRAFGEGGNGIADGEGVGALVLRPLADAEAAGDHIYGVIRGSSINAGGRSSSYTAPSSSAQAQLLQDAWQDANIDPRDISVIEGHGTGTELGDPIEVDGMTKAFRQHSKDRGFCALGSVKSNIGHTESAAGIAGITKVLLQMKHATLVPTLHSENHNAHIDFSNSPFVLPQKSTPWLRSDDATKPYLAGVSSFGAGGANAHVVLEEYMDRASLAERRAPSGSCVLVLSAQSDEQLRHAVRRLADHLERMLPIERAAADVYLADVAWTLQVGREAMAERIAFDIHDPHQAVETLANFVDEKKHLSPGALRGSLTASHDVQTDEAFNALITAWAEGGELNKIAEMWVRGFSVDWKLLHLSWAPRRVSLPTYPFARERFWINEEGNQKLSAAPLGESEPATTTASQARGITAEDGAMSFLTQAVSDILKLSPDRIKADIPLEEYGLDSVKVIQLMDALEKRFGTMSKTLFFEHRTLGSLANYFAEQYEQRTGYHDDADITDNVQSESPDRTVDYDSPIAVIGLAGRYPMADDLEQFWDNLQQGRDCVSEIPQDRWDHSRYYSPDRAKEGTTCCQKGGFLSGVDQFDAAFFNMLPEDAELTDPQERLFVECVHHALEDAGYTSRGLSSSARQDHDAGVGVFVGVMYEEYQLHGVEETLRGRPTSLSGSPASIANRVSYLFDFHGPSMAVDSMCSSSLTTLHLACQALRAGDCSVAVAGGVNLSLHPNKYMMLGRGGFESPQGHCAAFGAAGDGYVPSEGVGAAILKPLDQAMADGDRILGMIKATAINHGGKANGYTVPNPQSQFQVISSALRKSGVDAKTISYVEAHGTGTTLGDPIEVDGLTQAYGPEAGGGACAIGSVKSNIGHCESAAGIAGLTKVLLQMRHRKLAPSLHANPVNPHIAFGDTPFVVQQSLSTWQPEVNGHRISLRAGISSFGAGGANAHVIVEEAPADHRVLTAQADGPVAIVLSARSEKTLSMMVENLLNRLLGDELSGQKKPLIDIAYTLQVGRDALEERLGFVAADYDQLMSVLQALADGTQPSISVQTGRVPRWETKPRLRNSAEIPLDAYIAHWVDGVDMDWAVLYEQGQPRRVGLPLYPFYRQSFWAPQEKPGGAIGAVQGVTRAATGNDMETLLFQPVWMKAKLLNEKQPATTRVLFLCGFSQNVASKLRQEADEPIVHVLAAHDIEGARAFHDVACSSAAIMQNIASNGGENLTTIQVVVAEGCSEEIVSGLVALCRTVAQECPSLRMQTVVTDCGQDASALSQLIQEGSVHYEDDVVRHVQGHWQARHLSELENAQLISPWKNNGVYLISGGAGGLGLLFAREIATQAQNPVLILLGRSPLNEHKNGIIAELKSFGAQVEYHMVDIADKEAVLDVVQGVKAQFGTLTGILHSAGVLRDSYLVKKDLADFGAVFAPKVDGVDVLDDVTRHENLDMFACFSSMAGLTGNAGQSDYAMANGYLDGFAAKRNRLVVEGQRHGQTLSVNWPLWADGGMAVDEATEAFLMRVYGLAAMPSSVGMEAFARAFSSGQDQVLVAHGQAAAMRLQLDGGIALHSEDICSPADNGVPLDEVLGTLVAFVGETLRVPSDDVDIHLSLSDYGFDSISFTHLASRISEHFTIELAPSALFSYTTLSDLAGHVATLIAVSPAVFKGAEHYSAPDVQEVHTRQALQKFDHPLITKRISEFVFSATFTGDEPFFADHEIDGRPIFPGTAYLEMTLAAMQQITGKRQGVRLEAVRWEKVFAVNIERAELFIAFTPGDEQDYAFSIYSGDGEASVQHASGHAVLGAVYMAEQKDLAAAIARMTHVTVSGDACRDAFVRLGIKYGPSHQALHCVHVGDGEGVAELVRQERGDNDSWIVNPMFFDGVFQAGLALLADADGHFKDILSEVPISLDGLTVFAPMPEHASVIISRNTNGVGQKLSFTVCDRLGNVCAVASGLLTYPIAITHTDEAAFEPSINNPEGNQEPIAIIGMSGSFPMAKDLDAFWDNMMAGRDVISEIPPERWDWEEIYGDPLLEPGRTNVKWGGFMEDMNSFDPEFFGISLREAEALDPQQRLLMMHVWKAIEDAGYAPSSLAGTNTGLVIATVAIDYAMRLMQASEAIGGRSALGSIASVGPNRMSFFLDLHGPSEPVETACSSSLVALHRGVQALRNGESDMTVVGGINTMSTASGHIGFSQAGMLSKTGRCHTFSSNADGYVRGEGVGMLVLKSLRAAQADGDHIHGVILASGVNHGGRANSLTAPNPNAQADLIKSVYSKANIDPRSVSFIEAHGTGTPLGDPIEIDGLTRAFSALHEQVGSAHSSTPHIGIGAVKSHIGHLEMASGIAGVIKVLLQMRNRTLIGNLHCSEVNPYINFENTPFALVSETRAWEAPVRKGGGAWPLRAGVSSFGFGGVNAHVVLEEYQSPPRTQSHLVEPAVIVLSARTEDALYDTCRNLLTWIGENDGHSRPMLADVAWTLQIGRDAMVERIAFSASSFREIAASLQGYLNGENVSGLHRGQVPKQSAQPNSNSVILNPETAARLWVSGEEIDWQSLHRREKRQRVALPTYSFAKVRCWVDVITAKNRSFEGSDNHLPDHEGQGYASVVSGCIAELCGIDAKQIDPLSELRALGLDSIGMMQLVARLGAVYPDIDLATQGDLLLQATNVEDLVVRVSHANDGGGLPASKAASPSEDVNLDVMDADEESSKIVLFGGGGKKHTENVIVQNIRAYGGGKPFCRGTLVVDEHHAFFFDHPLDHISGMQLAEAMSAVAKGAHLHDGGMSADTPLFVTNVSLAFPKTCFKEPESQVFARCVSRENQVAHYEAEVRQKDQVVASAKLSISVIAAAVDDGGSAPTIDIQLFDPSLLNKRRMENVLISPIEQRDGSFFCTLVLQPKAGFFNDYPGSHIDTVVVAEAVRQCLRAAPMPERDRESCSGQEDALPLLTGIEIALLRPIQRTEVVEMDIYECEYLDIGGACHFHLKGRFLNGDTELGNFSATAMAVSSRLRESWSNLSG